MKPNWADAPAQMQGIAKQLDRQRGPMLTAIATTWVVFLVLFFSVGDHVSHTHAIAIASVAPLAFLGLWLLSVWAWFVRPAPTSLSLWSRAVGWAQSIFLVFLAVVLAFMSWGMARLFLGA